MSTPAAKPHSDVLIVTGAAGSGKSTALRAAEDAGYFCVDNLPVPLADGLLALLQQNQAAPKLALGMDLREPRVLDEAPPLLQRLQQAGHRVQVLFLSAQHEVLLRRYSQTRRLHPLDDGRGLREAIEREHALLDPLREMASEILDTSSFTPHRLRAAVLERLHSAASAPSPLRVCLMSFGFKNGVPTEADMVLDVRFLPNPFFVPELGEFAGTEKKVSDYVLQQPPAQAFLQHIETLLGFLLPQYTAERKQYFTLAIGCTGGRHRSVALAEELHRRLAQQQVHAVLRHRDMQAFVAQKEAK